MLLYGVDITCKQCGLAMVTSGLDKKLHTKKTIRQLDELREESKKQAKRRYAVMRDR
jgi:DNA-binding IclR family transcriptional regulator